MADIVDLILADHARMRGLFAALDGAAGREEHPGTPGMPSQAWARLTGLLELHAVAEEKICYPALFGYRQHTSAELNAAIADHNEIREAVHEARLLDAGSEAGGGRSPQSTGPPATIWPVKSKVSWLISGATDRRRCGTRLAASGHAHNRPQLRRPHARGSPHTDRQPRWAGPHPMAAVRTAGGMLVAHGCAGSAARSRRPAPPGRSGNPAGGALAGTA
ncbi:MAG: hemerythrin domain-containing protein [Streptosporangiaceae bacterium]